MGMVCRSKILVLGGDGFCGWPTVLHLSRSGYDVVVVDDLSRRAIDQELGTRSLTPIATLPDRLAAWHELGFGRIAFHNLTVGADYEGLLALLVAERPDAVVHFAEQRSAPYSMRSPAHRRYTVNGNMAATHDLCAAVVASGLDIHLVHLGSIGVYGYDTAGLEIPEGYLDVVMPGADGATRSIVYPTDPGSIYHLTKSQDQLLFQFYAKHDGLRVTDLHQGIVWGTQTAETRLDDRLVNRFDHDVDFGTVLNRFLVQAAAGLPLTVYGTGGQTRAFIHIQDTVRCIQLALRHPPLRGERVRILNQATETFRVVDLARAVHRLTGVPIAYLPNARREAEANELRLSNATFLDMGLKPTLLDQALPMEVEEIMAGHRSRSVGVVAGNERVTIPPRRAGHDVAGTSLPGRA